jgi:glycosyltransferase involved in cell wall biosynthesis
VRHSCYRENRVASAGVAAMLAVHHAAGTWTKAVDAYIALTRFSRARFIAGGLPEERLLIKPNFTEPDPGAGPGGPAFLYAGRLSEEKGLDVLIAAWRSRADMPPLKIIGDGPMAEWLKERIAGLPNVEWMGRLPREQVLEHMRRSRALVLPSIWYENFPVSIVEAYATGLPVIASDAGTLPELVRVGKTGFIFQSGNAAHLAEKVLELRNQVELQSEFRSASRDEFEMYYQREQNCKILLEIYRKAIVIRGSSGDKTSG